MIIEICKEYAYYQKQARKHLLIAIMLAILLITAMVLFIFFSRPQNAIKMQIIGSISASILVVILILEIYGGYLQNKYRRDWYKELLNSAETEIRGGITEIGTHKMTYRQGITFYEIVITGQVYYCYDEELYRLLKLNEKRTFILRSATIVGVKDDAN